MNLKNDLILRAANGKKIERTPVWLMRQAGRILPEYRKIRNSLSGFKELVETPHLAAEVTIQPVDILGVDAAIIFSDILVIPEAMGLPYEMIEKKGPYFPKTIESQENIDSLNNSDLEDNLSYVFEAIKITKNELSQRVPLIGFAGAPWTIFAYMIEGQGSKTFSKAKSFLYREPDLAHMLLEKITISTIEYLKLQIKAGVDLVQIFDSWAGILSPEYYNEFGMKYVHKICDEINQVPLTVFSKGAFFALESMTNLNCNTIGLDWTMDIDQAIKLFDNTKTLQGNLDPCVLYGDFNLIEKKTKEMLNNFAGYRHIANLGHGVYPDTSPEKVKCFIESVKSNN
jgi:uroporphyrinogen decarboxylase